MELKVVIDKKFAFMILGAILVLAGAIYGYAYGGSEPEVMGHSGDEIDGVQAATIRNCGSGRFIRSISSDGSTTCGNDNSGNGVFGGWYSTGPHFANYPCQVKNGITGSCSCPSGYTSTSVGSIGIPAGNSIKIYHCV